MGSIAATAHGWRSRAVLMLLVGFLGSATIVTSTGQASALTATSGRPTIAYFGDDYRGGLVKLNMYTGTYGFLKLGFNPGVMAITPDGKTAYAATNSDVYPVTLPSGPVGTPLSVGGRVTGIAVTPNGGTVYVAQGSGLTPITVSTNTVGTPIPITDSYGVAITPDGKEAYVTSNLSKAIYPVTLATSTVGKPISLPSAYPWGIQVTADGSTLYVITNTITGCGDLFAITVATRAVSQICNTQTTEYAYYFTVNPNGSSLYIPGEGAGGYLPEVLIPSNNTVNGPPCDPVCADANGVSSVVITPDGGSGYIADLRGYVQSFNTTTNTTGPDMATGRDSPGFGVVAPDQAPVARFTDTPAAHGSPSSFDASASYPRSTPIATYTWNFGDGTPVETVTTPTTTHTYPNAGTYKVTLTLTDTGGTSTQIVFTGQTVSRNGSKVAAKTAKVTIS